MEFQNSLSDKNQEQILWLEMMKQIVMNLQIQLIILQGFQEYIPHIKIISYNGLESKSLNIKEQ